MDKIHRVLVTLIKEQCANYCKDNNDILNGCLLSDRVCRYFTNNDKLARCQYLEESILPAENNNQARTLYYATLEAERNGEQINSRDAGNIIKAASRQIECERCRKMFKPTNNRQINCEMCSKIIRREHQRELMQNRRKIKQVC